jgi:hypothetical protein
MATRDATCIAPGFGTGNGREKMKKRENGIWGPKTGKWDGIWGYFPVFASTSRFFSNQCIGCTALAYIVASIFFASISFFVSKVIFFFSLHEKEIAKHNFLRLLTGST